VLAQAISLMAVLLLARLYSPTDFGVSAVFLSISNIVQAFATLRLDWSVPNTRTRVQAGVLMAIGFIAVAAISAFIFFLIAIGGNWLPLLQEVQYLGKWIFLLPVVILGVGLHQLLHSWFVREADLTAVSGVKITQSVVGVVTGVMGGVGKLGAIGLVASAAVSAWVGIARLVRHADGLLAALKRITPRRISAGWIRFKKEAILSSLVSLVNVASLSVTPLLLAKFYKAADVGAYALMLRIAVAPVGVITGAVSQSFWAEAANIIKIDKLRLKELYVRSTRRLAMVAVPVAVVAASGPLYVGQLFGEEWTSSGYVLASLAPYLLGQIVVSPLSHLIVHKKQHWQLAWDVSRLLMVATALVWLGWSGTNIYWTVLAASLVQLGMYVIIFFLNFRCLSK